VQQGLTQPHLNPACNRLLCTLWHKLPPEKAPSLAAAAAAAAAGWSGGQQ